MEPLSIGGVFSWKVANPRRMPSLSRFMVQYLRTRAGSITGARVLAMLAIVVGAHAVSPNERVGSAEAIVVTSLSAPMPVLHSVSSDRVAFSARSPSRQTDHVGNALPTTAYDELPLSLASRGVSSGASDRPRRSVASRGYDATAPPALS